MIFDEESILTFYEEVKEKTYVCPQCGKIIWPQVGIYDVGRNDRGINIKMEPYFLIYKGEIVSDYYCKECMEKIDKDQILKNNIAANYKKEHKDSVQ